MSTDKLLLSQSNSKEKSEQSLKNQKPELEQEEKRLQKIAATEETKQSEKKEQGENKSDDKDKEEVLSQTNENTAEKSKTKTKTKKKTKTQVPNHLKKLQVDGTLPEQVSSKRKRTQTTQFDFSSFSDKEEKKAKKQDQGKQKDKKKSRKPNAHRASEQGDNFDAAFSLSSLSFPFGNRKYGKEIENSESSHEGQKMELQEGLKLLSKKLFYQLTQQLALFQSDKVRNFYQDKKEKEEDGKKEATTSNQKILADYENVFVPKENIGLIKQIAIESNRYCNASNREILLEFCFVDPVSRRFGFRVFNLKSKSSKHLNKEQNDSNAKDVVGPSQVILFEMDLKNSEDALVLVSEKPALRVFTSLDCKNLQTLKKEYEDFCLKSNLQRKLETAKSSIFPKADRTHHNTDYVIERKTKKRRRRSAQTAEQKKSKLKKANKKKEKELAKENLDREDESTLPKEVQAQLAIENGPLEKEIKQETAQNFESSVGAEKTNDLDLAAAESIKNANIAAAPAATGDPGSKKDQT